MLLKKLRLTIKANNAKPTPPIGPMLGQRGLNIKEFCTLFNTMSQSYIESTPLVTDLIIDKNNHITIQIHGPTLHYVLTSFIQNNTISIKTLFLISSYFKKYDKRYENIEIQSIFRTIINTCKKMKLNIN